MDKNSSIFNFKSAFSPAFAMTVLLVFVIDAWVIPQIPNRISFFFEQNNFDLPGRRDYEALRAVLTYGPQMPVDVAILGSSRAREGVLAPHLKEQLNPHFKHDVKVAHYTIAASRVFEFELLAQRLTDNQILTPRVVVLPINPRFLQSNAHRNHRRFYLMTPKHIMKDVGRFGLDSPLHLVEVLLSNTVNHTFALRYAAREWREGKATHTFAPFESNPIFGGLGKYQAEEAVAKEAGTRIKSLDGFQLGKNGLDKYLHQEWPPGVTHLGELEKEAFVTGLKTLRDHDVTVLILDLPMSHILEPAIPQEGLQNYRNYLVTTAQELDVDLMGQDDWPPFYPAEFREQSHLNLYGARKLTQFIAERLLDHHRAQLQGGF
tara:strand:- start:390 stop:1517 length:1128 start_codon:yes stop_codon:yes gene_type:complete